ncbi:hypothetical protein A4X09_0g7489, partial [Tilletia walkeri]
ACNAAAAASYPFLLGLTHLDISNHGAAHNDAVLPPRLPLCSGTIPCPVDGCSRSAIGRGIGSWSGYHARYGPLPVATPSALDDYPAHPPNHAPNHYTTITLPTFSKVPSAGTPPFDGFIVGVPDHPTNLAILPAQRKFPIPSPTSTASSSSASASASATALRLKNAAGIGNAIAIHPLVNDEPSTPRTDLAVATHALPVDPAFLDPAASSEGPTTWKTIRSDVTLSKLLDLLRSQIAAETRRQEEEEGEEEEAREAERIRLARESASKATIDNDGPSSRSTSGSSVPEHPQVAVTSTDSQHGIGSATFVSSSSSSAVALQRSKSEQSGGSTRLSHKQQGKRPETAIEGQDHQGHNVEDAAAATAGPSRLASVRRRRHSSYSSLLSSPAGSHDLNFSQSTQPPDWRHRFGEDIDDILDSDGQLSQRGSGNTLLSSPHRPHVERTRSQPMIASTSLPGFSSSSSSHTQLPDGGHDVGPVPRALVHDDNSPSLEFSDLAFFANRDHHRQHSYSHSSPQSPSSFSSPPHLHHNRRSSRFSSTHVRSSRDRVPIARSALALLGGSELGRESGAAGGIRATSLSGSATGSEIDSDEFEEEEDGEGQRYGGHARRKASRRMRGRGRGRGRGLGMGMGMGMGLGLLRTDMYHASEMEDEFGSGASGHRRTEVQARFGSRTSDTSRRGPGDVGTGGGSGSGRRISKHQARHHQHQQQHHQHQQHHHRRTDSDHEAEVDADDHLMMDLGRVEDDSPSRDGAADRSSKAQGPTSTGMVSQNHPETGVSSSAPSKAGKASPPRSPLRCPTGSHSADSGLSTESTPSESSSVQLAEFQTALLDVLECQLCYLLLYEPVTTPCGHTFCRSCFARNLDHSDRCPLCKTRMPSWGFWQDHPSARGLMDVITLEMDRSTPESEDWDMGDPIQGQGPRRSKLVRNRSPTRGVRSRCPTSNSTKRVSPSIEKSHANTVVLSPSSSTASKTASTLSRGELATVKWELPSLYTERRLAAELDEAKARLSAPIFVCTLAYPEMPTVLHIYEPRYRLMVRRCLESGNPRFGMVMPARTSSPNAPGMYEYGTMLEIRSVQMLPDGRSMIETVGSYRFRVLETGTLDGYSVGRVERIEDVGLEEEMEMERTFVEFANGAARAAGAVEPTPISAETVIDNEDGQAATRANRVPATDSAGYVLGLDVGVADALARAAQSRGGQTGTLVQGVSDERPQGSLNGGVVDAETTTGSADSNSAHGLPAPASSGNSMGPMLVALHPTMDELVDV